MEKVFIENRRGQKIAVVIEQPEASRGLAFVMHGLGGFKEQVHVEMFARCFVDNGFTTVRFDTADTIGESGGRYEDATITSYYRDLEDVISWSKSQDWYSAPFFLVGHSLGGISTALYAEQHPEEIMGLAPISSVISGALSQEAHRPEDDDKWKQTGWQTRMSRSKPGVELRLPWSHMEDRLKYDLLKDAKKLTMPVLLIVGEIDEGTPPRHQQKLFDVLPGEKELHVISGAGHSYREQGCLDQVKVYLDNWIKKVGGE